MASAKRVNRAAIDLAELAPRLRRLAVAFGRMIEAECGLTPAQTSALVAIGQQARRVNEVAEQTQQHQSGASRVVDSLVAAGLVHRTEDPDDRRASHLQLTSAGTRALRQIAETEKAVTRSILTQMSPDTASKITQIMRQYVDIAETILERTQDPK